MAAVNYICIKPFTDDRRCVRAQPGMALVFDTAVATELAKVNSHLAQGVILLATDTTNTHPTMVALQKLATA